MKLQKQYFIEMLADTLGSRSIFYHRLGCCDGDLPIESTRTASETLVNLELCLSLAQAHGLAGMLYHALPRLPAELQPDPSIRDLLKRLAYTSAIRDAIQDNELQELNKEFQEKNLAFLPLKGYEIKKLYPKPEMRYMSDTDLLIDPLQAEAVRLCFEGLGFRVDRYDKGDTDIYTSPSGLQYEVHRSVEREGFNDAARRLLKELLSYAQQEVSLKGMLCLPHEIHYAYILCHFVKHFLFGGIGVRQVMDIYLCRTKWKMDDAKLDHLLTELKLAEFAASVEALGAYWFGEAKGAEVTEELGEYILSSGVFGNEEHKVANQMLKEKRKQSRVSYFFSRVFLPYRSMCFYYPILKKWWILLPVLWMWRIFYALVFRRKKLKQEMSTLAETDRDALRQRADFYKRCGLDVYDVT